MRCYVLSAGTKLTENLEGRSTCIVRLN
jgi:hypothetical protein